jgi:hypothetical protein
MDNIYIVRVLSPFQAFITFAVLLVFFIPVGCSMIEASHRGAASQGYAQSYVLSDAVGLFSDGKAGALCAGNVSTMGPPRSLAA